MGGKCRPVVLGVGEVEALAAALADRGGEWRRKAACRGLDTGQFFPERGDMHDATCPPVCATCGVRVECLAFGLREQVGTYGGMSAVARGRLRRQLIRLGVPVRWHVSDLLVHHDGPVAS